MKRIDFYNKKKAIHNEMLEAIANLFKEADITEIDFTSGERNPYIILSPDGASSTYEALVTKVRCKDGSISVMVEDYDRWISCRHAGCVVTGTIDDLYDAVFDYVELKKQDKK